MFSLLFADVQTGVNAAIKFLAIMGGAVCAGVVAGALVGVLSRLATSRPLPLWGRMVVRLGGAIIGGLLVYYLWGGGGWGPFGGGSGTDGQGQETGKGQGTAPGSGPGTTPATTPRPTEPAPTTLSASRIEVLGKKPLVGTTDPDRCYRVGGPKGKVLTLGELENLIGEQIKQQPPLRRITIVSYKDSPGLQTHWVTDLEEFARGKKLEVKEETEKNVDAPMP